MNMDLRLGSVVAERYRIEEPIGFGGMGCVFRATQLDLDRQVALKVILPHQASDEASRARFVYEANNASRLEHPNAIEVYDFGEDQGRLFIAMRLLQGSLLREYLDEQGGSLHITEALSIATQLADVLAAAHRIPLVHRDIKPENIGIENIHGDQRRPVLLDFGLSVSRSQRSRESRLTRDHGPVGTPHYISPEQAKGKMPGPATDVYSLGCVLYEMLVGAPPFDGEPAVISARHLYLEPTPIRALWPSGNIPKEVDDLVLQMLHKQPVLRPSSEELRARFRHVDLEKPGRMNTGQLAGESLGRHARMISWQPGVGLGSEEVNDYRLGVLGRVDQELKTAVGCNSLTLCELSDEPTEQELSHYKIDAIFAPEVDIQVLASLVRMKLPVFAVSAKGDVSRLRTLIRLGVAEVVTLPVSPAVLAKKVRRVLDRRKKGRICA